MGRALMKVTVLSAATILTALIFGLGCEAERKVLAGDSDADSDSDSDSDVDSDVDSDADSDSDDGPCDEGEHTCVGNDYMECTNGEWTLVETCELECVSFLGCVECVPEDTYCEDDIVMKCDETGSGYFEYQDCTEFETVCVDGECFAEDPCEAAAVLESNIGCEYWAVDLDNSENQFDDAAAGQFAVVVANIGSNGTAHVEVHINKAAQGLPLDLELVESHDIPETELYIFRLPRRDVDGDSTTDNQDEGPQTWLSSRAFRITSDVPVVAYQFNTLDQQFSNDASLLLPTSGLGKDHLVLGYPPGGFVAAAGSPRNRAYVTILGAQEDTEVTVNVTTDIEAGEGVDAIPAGGSATFLIGPFDVLNLETRLYTLSEVFTNPTVDLSGTTVTSDKPVAVFFGVDLTSIGQSDLYPDSCCAEHIEQQIIPSKSMGQKFVVSHSAQRNSGTPEMDYYRIIAYQSATVTTSLPAPYNQFSLAEGDFVELFSNTGFTVETTDGYLHVAQYLVEGGNTDANIGDSSLLYVPAIEQRRGLYVFTTGEGFAENAMVVSMVANTTVHYSDGGVLKDVNSTNCSGPLDNGALDGHSYVAYDCPLADGAHTVFSGSSPEETEGNIGVFVYGYYSAGSYAYPAGSDLRHTNPGVVVK